MAAPTAAVLLSQQVRYELRAQVDQLRRVIDRLERLIETDDTHRGAGDDAGGGDRRAPR